MYLALNYRLYSLIVMLLLLPCLDMTTASAQPSPLVIDGQGQAIKIQSRVISTSIILMNAPDSIIEDNILTDGSNLVVINSENTAVRNNTVINANSYSIIVEFSDNSAIYNNMVINGSRDGIIAYQNDNIVIHNNTIHNVVKNGIYTNGRNMSIINNVIQDVDGTGIFMLNSQESKVHGNPLSSISWTPIAPDQETFETSSFVNNTIDNDLLTRADINPSGADASTNSLLTTSSTNQSLPFLFLQGIIAIIIIRRLTNHDEFYT